MLSLEMLKNKCLFWLMVIIMIFLGMIMLVVDEGVEIVIGLDLWKFVESIKNVIRRKVRFIIGVMLMEGEFLGIFILGILY